MVMNPIVQPVNYRVLKWGGVQGEGVTWEPVWEDWGTLGKIRVITTPLKNPINLPWDPNP